MIVDSSRKFCDTSSAICLRFSMDRSGGSSISIGCSCRDETLQESCEHSKLFKECPSLMAKIHEILRVQVDGAPREESIGTMQIPLIGKERHQFLLWFNRQVKLRYLPSVVMLVEKLQRTGTGNGSEIPFSLRIRCLRCRRNARRRGHFEHETAVIRTNASIEVRATTHAPQIDISFPQFDEFDENTLEVLLKDSTSSTSGKEYVSKLPRQFVRCVSDDNSLREILSNMDGRSKNELWAGTWATLWDIGEACTNCMAPVHYDPADKNSCEALARTVQFHGLRSGKVRLRVLDLICCKCANVNYYDGRSNGLFSCSSTVTFSRELLDLWVYQVCALGATFREAYDIFNIYSNSLSARFGREGLPDTIHRRVSASCFAAYLHVLQLPTEEKLGSIFTCESCEENLENGGRRLKSVVMDGTAVGILRKLPKFTRISQLVRKVDRCTRPQFLLRTPQVELLVDEIFYSCN